MSLSNVAQLDRLLVEPSANRYKVRGAADSLAARHIVRLLEGRETDRARLAGVRHGGGWAMFDQPLTAHSLRGALQHLLA